jgi:alkylation response protein AidB-like acyl-CoA dehydrogenase
MRDTLSFLMYDWLRIEELLRRERFAEHSRDTLDAMLDTSERVANERFAPFNRIGDVEEPTFDGERVRLPPQTAEAVKAYAEMGLVAAGHDSGCGGMQLPYVVEMAANALFAKASVALHGYGMLTTANANLLMAHGTPAQQRAFAQPQLEGRFLGTMCLSEPEVGSSLGDIATRATADGPRFDADPLGPRYRLRGNKMWISGGEHEMGENIVHLVLAKIADADDGVTPGVKGISLFVVPRILVDCEGTVSGERNDVALAGLNHKLGHRATVNTLLNFGEGRFPVRTAASDAAATAGAVGYLVGVPGRGLDAMFHMMNEARINVGMGATMLAYAGYEASLGYARVRTQGRSAADRARKAGTRPVPIIEHADVRRMLLAQKSYCEGGLALVLYCARLVDEKRTAEAGAAADAALLLEVLTPIAKSWPSEWGVEANSLAIQVHGGFGYTRDFPVEQHWRDNRLNMIHEGTHGIQALDLLGRKVRLDGGRAFALLLGRIADTVGRAMATPGLEDLAANLRRSADALRHATNEAWASGDPERALANATPYLQAFGHVVVAWLWLAVALAANGKLKRAADSHDFAQGKLQAARYFFRHELRKIDAWLAVVRSCDTTCSDTRPEWF